jgi:GMP synthase (glutamine-hydrolysing)
MRVLIVDNTIDQDSWGSVELRRLAHLGAGAAVHVRRAPQGDLPRTPIGYDRVILSGSKTSALEDAPWISELHEFVARTLDAGIPFLGVCFGHQTLARVICGRQVCRKAEPPEIGWTEIEIIRDSALLAGLPPKFYSFSSHYEEVGSLPPQFRNLARSEACAIQAFQLEERPVYGIQFHPERDAVSADKTFAKKKSSPATRNDPLLHPTKSAKLFDPNVGETIFKNFLKV